MKELLSCPFCRELFAPEEGSVCPDCDLPLVPLQQLPLSLEGQAEARELGVDPPEDQSLPLLYVGRGRGPLCLIALFGLSLFFAPWVSLERPDIVELTGFSLASRHAPWLFGGAVGWFVLLPLLLSRRTVRQLHGIRVIAVFFAALTTGETALLLLRPPGSNGYFSSGLEYGWGLYGSLVCALLGCLVAARLGGSLEDLRDLPVEVPDAGPSPNDHVH